MYFNTTNLKSEELKAANKKAAKQSDVILSVFKCSHLPLSPSRVLKLVSRSGFNYPLTSIRRAISDLTSEGYLVKTDQRTKGIYDAYEYMWKLAA